MSYFNNPAFMPLLLFLMCSLITYLLFTTRKKFGEGEIRRIVNDLSLVSWAGMLLSLSLLLKRLIGQDMFHITYSILVVAFVIVCVYAAASVFFLAKELSFDDKAKKVWFAVAFDSVLGFFKGVLDSVFYPDSKKK